VAEYTPTTEEVRNWDGCIGTPMPPEEFDRWLAARDREVAAKALREAATALRSHGVEHEPQANWLRERADRIEKGAGDVR
jgi:hypothetical protein